MIWQHTPGSKPAAWRAMKSVSSESFRIELTSKPCWLRRPLCLMSGGSGGLAAAAFILLASSIRIRCGGRGERGCWGGSRRSSVNIINPAQSKRYLFLTWFPLIARSHEPVRGREGIGESDAAFLIYGRLQHRNHRFRLLLLSLHDQARLLGTRVQRGGTCR